MAEESDREKRLKEERDYWRSEAARLDEENANLKRMVERVSDFGLAIAGNGGIAEKYQRQRDELRSAIQDAHQAALILVEDAETFAVKQFEGIPDRAPGGFEKAKREALAVRDAIHSTYDKVTSPLHDSREEGPKAVLWQALTTAQLSGIYNVLAARAWEERQEKDPLILCATIKWELEQYGEPHELTVARLPREWIKEHIGAGRGIRHSKLKEALVHAYRYETEYLDSGRTATSYDVDHHVSEDSLKKYRRYLKNIRECASKAPEDAKRLLEVDAET